MIKKFEKSILEKINFPERYIDARNAVRKDPNSTFTLSKKDVKTILQTVEYKFLNIKNTYFTDIAFDTLKFRLFFDISNNSINTYVFVLKDEKFIENGLSDFGYMLNYFDLSKYEINQNFGFNSMEDVVAYFLKMIAIFNDFKDEYLSLRNLL